MPPEMILEAPSPSIKVLGGTAFGEVIRNREGPDGETPVNGISSF